MLDSKISFCKKCVTPSSRPRIRFDSEGICNACNFVNTKNITDWEKRKKEFLNLLEEHRSSDGSYDCIVPWSGGKDSSYIAYLLKFKFNMNPLLVTFSPLITNEIGEKNRKKMLELGFDNLMGRPNQKVSRYLSKRFFRERGNPKTHWDAGVGCFPVQIANKYDIKAIFYAEDSESEYGGKVLNKKSMKLLEYDAVMEHVIEDHPSNWVSKNVSINDLQPYLYPNVNEIKKKKISSYYFSYFFRFDMYKNYLNLKDVIDFETLGNKRSVGTFTNFDSLDDKIDDLYYYMQYIKFGFGRCTRDCSRFIQNGHLSRKEAVQLVKKFDGEFPKRNLDEVLNFLSLNKSQLLDIIDEHRNQEIWNYSKGSWKLSNSVFES